jgi:hypothetical protein
METRDEDVPPQPREAISAAERSTPMRLAVRTGFLARAVTYGVVGGLALALAFGAGTDGTAPNQQGALALVARAPLGLVALIVIAAGLLAYAVWKFSQAVRGRGPEGGGGPSLWDRVGNFFGGAAYLVFFALAVRVLVGRAGNASTATEHAAAGVLSWPGGRWLVGTSGAILIAVSLYQIYDALSGRFAAQSKTGEMSARGRRAFMWLGRVGLTARALVFVLIGYFILRTAIGYNPRDAVGVDGALGRLHHEPLGPWLVAAVAAGVLMFAVYSAFEARYRRL